MVYKWKLLFKIFHFINEMANTTQSEHNIKTICIFSHIYVNAHMKLFWKHIQLLARVIWRLEVWGNFFFFLMRDFPVVQHHVLKRLLFPPILLNDLGTVCENRPRHMGLWTLNSIPLIYTYFCQYYPVSITLALQ